MDDGGGGGIRASGPPWRAWPAMIPIQVAQRAEQVSQHLTDAARRVEVPTLVVRGGRSDVTSDQGMAEFLNTVPHAEHVTVGEAGHIVAGDRNDAFTAAVVGFLGRHTATPEVAS